MNTPIRNFARISMQDIAPPAFKRPIYVSPKEMPTGNSCDFGLMKRKLPTPQEVRRAAKECGFPLGKCEKPVPFCSKELGLVVKWGKHADVTIAEGQCLWFLRKHLRDEVPVPQIYGWNKDHKYTFLYMEFVEGIPLALRWDEMEEEERDEVCEQLRGMVTAWRRIKPAASRKGGEGFSRKIATLLGSRPSGEFRLSQIGGQCLRDHMFEDGGSYPGGPFRTLADFHTWLAEFSLDGNKQLGTDARELYPEQLAGLTDDVEVVFTHGDLFIDNIIISAAEEGPLKIKAVVDWHTAGWYPEPWEWLKAQSIDREGDWPQCLPKIIRPAQYDYWYAWEFISMRIRGKLVKRPRSRVTSATAAESTNWQDRVTRRNTWMHEALDDQIERAQHFV